MQKQNDFKTADPLTPQERAVHDDTLAYEDYTQWVTRCPHQQKALLDAYVQTKYERLGLKR